MITCRNIPWHVIHLESVDSTNSYAAALLGNDNPAEGTVILADYQQKGKGQGGNSWLSEKNQNLLFSIILRPSFLRADRQFYLSMCISNGLAEFVKSAAGDSAIKWPNDILLKGKKTAGILIENTVLGDMLNTSIIGIGLNLNQQVFPPELPDAVSLSLVTDREYNIIDTLKDVLDSISSGISQLYNGRTDMVRTAYLNRLHGLNEWAQYADSNGVFEGRITDVADSGELIVVTRSGETRQYGFKEIKVPGSRC